MRSSAARLLQCYGCSSTDYFKLQPDKNYFFTKSGNSFLAYGVSHKIALVLGDPTGPAETMAGSICEFVTYCHKNKWRPVFHQVSHRYIDIYKSLGFRPFKTSEVAIVNLKSFSARAKASFRNTLNRMEREGMYIQFFDKPVPMKFVEDARVVSNSWLSTGRQERKFVLGNFETEYVRNTAMLAAFNAKGEMQGFVNIIPSYAPKTATIDLMRYQVDAPNGLMDFLFLELFEYLKRQGVQYFSMGAAPITKLAAGDKASLEERVFYKLTHHLDFHFRMSGLRNYKAKFATIWEPRYLIHNHITDLPRVLQAFIALTELKENQKPILSKEWQSFYGRAIAEVVTEVWRVQKEKYKVKRRFISIIQPYIKRHRKPLN